MADKNTNETHTQVLIVGGGITGLSAALFLLNQGITPIVIEKHPSTSVHPRSRGFDIRTMELFRELKLGGQIREAGKSLSPSWGILTAQSLVKALEKRKIRNPGLSFPSQMKGLESIAALSPETGARCTQDLSEPILLKAVIDKGAAIHFNTELISFTQDKHEVTAIINKRETKEQIEVKADFMIAADGAQSLIRELSNAKTEGPGALGNLLNIYFEADLKACVNRKEFSILRIDEPKIKGFLSAINNSDRWAFQLYYNPDFGDRPEDFKEGRLISILQKVIGIPEIKIRIISVLPWKPTIKVVENMRHGRIFFAGDAAHVMTPYGGKGANTGIQDVHNLAWKLALVLMGKAHPDLLQTYNAERRPVGWHYAQQSGMMADHYGLLKKPTTKRFLPFLGVMILNKLHLHKIFPKAGLGNIGKMLGLPHYKYLSAAIVSDDKKSKKFNSRLNGAPGTRMPHFWITIQGEKVSTLDFLGRDFVLFTGSKNKIWQKVIEIIAEKYEMKIPVHNFGKSGIRTIPESKFHAALGIEQSGAILVRPDGFVAWKSRNGEANDYKSLYKAMMQILAVKNTDNPLSDVLS